jgi:hypothetical protein
MSSYGQYSDPGYGGATGEKPKNYLVWAILTTLLCSLPFGIVSIIFAAQVDGKWQRGDHAGALQSSRRAKTFAIVAAVLGVVVAIIYGILFATGALTTDSYVNTSGF